MGLNSVYPRPQRLRSSRLIFLALFTFALFKLINLGWNVGYDASTYKHLFSLSKPQIQHGFQQHDSQWGGYTIKPIAYVFPQFHAIPENDKFWGVNFTEWTNVKKVKENRYGLETLHPTKEIGYYNLMDYDVRKRYAKLVKDSGYVHSRIPVSIESTYSANTLLVSTVSPTTITGSAIQSWITPSRLCSKMGSPMCPSCSPGRTSPGLSAGMAKPGATAHFLLRITATALSGGDTSIGWPHTFVTPDTFARTERFSSWSTPACILVIPESACLPSGGAGPRKTQTLVAWTSSRRCGLGTIRLNVGIRMPSTNSCRTLVVDLTTRRGKGTVGSAQCTIEGLW